MTFAGGGNLACSSIAVIGHLNPKWKINILTRNPQLFNKEIVAHTAKSDDSSSLTTVRPEPSAGSDGEEPPPGAGVAEGLAAASSSRFHPSALPFTAPRLLHPPHLPPVLPPPTVDQGTQTGDGPERRIDSISRLVRWVLQHILPVMCF